MFRVKLKQTDKFSISKILNLEKFQYIKLGDIILIKELI